MAICILKICFVNFVSSYNSTVSDLSGKFIIVFNNLSFFFQSIAFTTSKYKQYFCTVFFSFLARRFMNTSDPKHKRR